MATELVRLADALEHLAGTVTPLADHETVPLAEAAGRVLAEDLVAALPLPCFDNAAMDGYAVRGQDLGPEGGGRFPLAGRVPAGRPLTGAGPPPGSAIRVFTGAPLPVGWDSVAMQEHCEVADGSVTLRKGIEPGLYRRLAGEDVQAGQRLLSAGTRLGTPAIAMAAAQGRDTLTVVRRPRVAVLSNGDEVRAPGTPLDPGTLYDANRPMLLTLLKAWGVEVVDLGILQDERTAVHTALEQAATKADAVVTSGGMSVGEEDHMRSAIESLGSLDFWRLAVRPGKPVAVGHLTRSGRRLPVIGLPGNPVAALVMTVRLGRPILRRLAGEPWRLDRPWQVRVGFHHQKMPGRREILRVRLETGKDGWPLARKHPNQGSGHLSALLESDAFLDVPEDADGLSPGERADCLPFAEVLR